MAAGAAIAAVAGTAYTIYSSERARSDEKKRAREARKAEEQARLEEQRRYEQARKDWEGALERARGQYKGDVAKAEELRGYYSEVAEDPMSTSVWRNFTSQIETEYQGAKGRIAEAVQSRGGLRGGVSEELLGQLETAKTEQLGQTLSRIIAEAKAQYAAVPNPAWNEPTFQGIGSPAPQYAGVYFAPPAFQSPDLSAFGALAASDTGEEWDKAISNWWSGLWEKGGTLNQPAPYAYESTQFGSPLQFNREDIESW